MSTARQNHPDVNAIQTVSTSENEPAALLLKGTRIVQLLGDVEQLNCFQQWKLELNTDLVHYEDPSVLTIANLVKLTQLSQETATLTINQSTISALPFDDGLGSPMVMLVFTPTVKEEKQLQNEINDLNCYLEMTLKHSGVGIFEFDPLRPDWCFSTHIELLLGLKKGSLGNSRSKIRERIHPDDREVNEHNRQQNLAGEETKFEIRLRVKNDEYRWFAVSVQATPMDNTQRFLGTITDINDIKNSQLASAAQINRRDEFLAMLSHELRNPLMAIRYSVDLLTDFNQARATSREFLNIISRQTSQMSRLLDDLLDVSRIVQNRLEYEFGNHNFNDALRDVVETVRSSLAEKKQAIRVQLCEQDHFIDGDITRVKQAIVNLLENASKYTEDDGEIKICSRVADGHVIVEISDNGIGIPKEDQERIFDLFFQKNKKGAGQSRGMGVGLFLVQSVIAKHNGKVSVESDGAGHGSLFRVTLPITEKKVVDTETKPRQFNVGKKTVCLIEDIADSRIALKILLEHRGFEVFEFADAESALEKIPDMTPDAAIIDIGLPGKSGLDLADDLRNQHGLNEMLMIALTGYGQEADCKEIDRVGFDHHLIKPAGIRKVCQVISNFFEHEQGITEAA